MGQGFSLATPSAGSAGIDIPQLQDIQYERSIGDARFMKSIRARDENAVVLVKVLVKPFPEVKLDKYRRQIIGTSKADNKLVQDGTTNTFVQNSARPSLPSPTPSASSESSRPRQTATSSASSCTAPSTTA